MTSGKKKRMSMLDNLAATGGPAPTPQAGAVTPMMTSNRALRSARDAVDSHHVWELDPASIVDDRMADRLDPADVHDLRAAIEANGQTVPILVRRHPSETDRYLLVYGRRRLEGIRQSELARRLGVTRQAVGELVGDLVALGVLELVPDPDDRRAKRVRFSAAGEDGLFTGLSILEDLERELARDLGDARAADLRASLAAIVARLEG